MLCVSLVQGARTTLRMWRRQRQRDWHTQSESSALPQATSGKPSQESDTAHGVILGQAKRDPRISVGPSQGLAGDPLEPNNQDSRHKAEKDIAHAARQEADKVRVPGAGRGPVLREAQTHAHGCALARADQTPALILSSSKDAGDSAERIVPTRA